MDNAAASELDGIDESSISSSDLEQSESECVLPITYNNYTYS